MIKKTIAALALVTALAASGLIYPATMEVVSLDRATDTVTLNTATGITYTMHGCEDYAEGDLVSALMWNSETPDTVADDAIIAARYSGYTKN